MSTTKKPEWLIAHEKSSASIDARIVGILAALDKTNATLDKIGERVDKNAAAIKALTYNEGEAANNRGFAFERAVWQTMEQTLEIGGIRLDGVRFNLLKNDYYQYDVVGLNGNKTVVVECKLSMSEDDAEHFATKRLPYFAGLFPEYAKGKEIIGAMVYQRTIPTGEAVKAALSHGLLVLYADNKKHLHQVKSPDDIKERPPRTRPKKTRPTNKKPKP